MIQSYRKKNEYDNYDEMVSKQNCAQLEKRDECLNNDRCRRGTIYVWYK